ncbi:hypothetical protein [Breoghania sp. L-A4]|uniref:hypothetical protein n=1 Tax=Breoghania sp. L-A4 TaxID=2304600 RepID=UPI0013C2EB2E|nr:hypothetical protein [Breoghania sp. L-A4]
MFDERVLDDHFFPGLVFEFHDTTARRLGGRPDLPYLRALEPRNPMERSPPDPESPNDERCGPGGLTQADIAGEAIVLCALTVAETDHDFRFHSWTGADRNIAEEAADAIRSMQSGLPTRILLMHEDLLQPRGQAAVTAALNAYTGGAFMSDRVERRGNAFQWAVLTQTSRTFVHPVSGLVGFEGPEEAPVSILHAGDLQRRLATPWQAGYSRNSDAFADLRGSGDFDCVSFVNTWETSPVIVDANPRTAEETEDRGNNEADPK